MNRPPTPAAALLAAVSALTALAAPLAAQAAQEIQFANIFNDHMVLQRDRPVRLWGLATARARVTVTVTERPAEARKVVPAALAEIGTGTGTASAARRGRSGPADPPLPTVRMRYVDTAPQEFATRVLQAQADQDGRWEVTLAPMPASFRPKFVIAAIPGAGRALRDVLVGDVWLTSGQSNMVWGVGADSEWGMERLSVDFPAIRLCRFQRFTPQPQEDLERRVDWDPAVPENRELHRFSGVSYFFAVRMHRALKVPIGIVNNSVGGSLAETWTSRASLAKLPACRDYLADFELRMKDWPAEKARRIADHEKRRAAALKRGSNEPRRPDLSPPDADRNQPAGCYNGSIHPIRRLALRGALFLQGENNSIGKWNMYAQSFPQMIEDWRQAFAEPELPFGIITVQGFGPYGGELEPEMLGLPPGLFWYAAIRDVHRRTHAALPHTGLIAAADVGDTANIHPGLKREVAQRAARWALAQVHGKDVLFTGPRYRSMRIDGRKIVLQFDMDPNLGKVMDIKPGETVWWRDYPISRAGKEYRGFSIAGADRRFYPATARRGTAPGTLEVTSAHVPEPEAVRYAWSGYPDANAIGHDFLPVFPFRTDDWPWYPDTPYSAAAKRLWNQDVAAARKRAERLALERRLRETGALLAEVTRALRQGQGKSKEERAAVEKQVASIRGLLDALRERLRAR